MSFRIFEVKTKAEVAKMYINMLTYVTKTMKKINKTEKNKEK